MVHTDKRVKKRVFLQNHLTRDGFFAIIDTERRTDRVRQRRSTTTYHGRTL